MTETSENVLVYIMIVIHLTLNGYDAMLLPSQRRAMSYFNPILIAE
jgi:hypothetical protein